MQMFRKYSEVTTSCQIWVRSVLMAWHFREILSFLWHFLTKTFPTGKVSLKFFIWDAYVPLMVFLVVVKLGGKFWSYKQHHTPFDVVAWHGKSVLLPV